MLKAVFLPGCAAWAEVVAADTADETAVLVGAALAVVVAADVAVVTGACCAVTAAAAEVLVTVVPAVAPQAASRPAAGMTAARPSEARKDGPARALDGGSHANVPFQMGDCSGSKHQCP